MADRHLHLVYDADTNNSAPPPQTFDTGGGGGNNGDMRDRLTALETRFDSVLPTLATKADIEDLRTGIHKVDATIKTWMLGTVLTIIGTMLAAILVWRRFLKTLQPLQFRPAHRRRSLFKSQLRHFHPNNTNSIKGKFSNTSNFSCSSPQLLRLALNPPSPSRAR